MRTFEITSELPIFPKDLPKIGKIYRMSVQADNVGDAYHTLHDLYQHRLALNVALFKLINRNILYLRVGKSKLHYDGTMFDGDYFVVFVDSGNGKDQVTYHYNLKHWDEFKIPEYECVPFPYDGHTSNDTIKRL